MSGAINLSQLVQLTQFNLGGSLIFGCLSDTGEITNGPLATDVVGSFAYASQAQATARVFHETAPSRAGLIPIEPDMTDPYDLELHLYIDEIPSFDRQGIKGTWVGLGHYRLQPNAYEIQHGPRVQVRTEQETNGGRPIELAIEYSLSGFNMMVRQEEGIRFPQKRGPSWGMLGTQLGSRLFLERLLGAHAVPNVTHVDQIDEPFHPQDVSMLFELGLHFYSANPERWAEGFYFDDYRGDHYAVIYSDDGTGHLVNSSGQRIEFDDYVPHQGAMNLRSAERVQGTALDVPALCISLASDGISISEHLLNPAQTSFSSFMRQLIARSQEEVQRQLTYIQTLSPEERLASLAEAFGIDEATFRARNR